MKLGGVLANLRRRYLHILAGGKVSAEDLSRIIATLEAIEAKENG